MNRIDSILQLFKKFPLFVGIPEEALIRFVKDFEIKNFKKNEIIIQQSQPCQQAYLLIEGKIKIYCENKFGMQTTVLYHRAPFLFGEVEILEQFSHTASVIALEPCKAIVLNRNDYISLLHSNHQFCFNVTKLLSRLLYQAGEDRRIRFFGQVEHLLASAICALAQLEGETVKKGISISRKISKTELAALLGVSRKSVIAAFRQLERKDLLTLEGGYIFVPDLTLLQEESKKL